MCFCRNRHRPRRGRIAEPLVIASLLLAPLAARAHETESFLERYAATYRFRLGIPATIRPTPDGRAVLFLRSGPRSFVRDLYELDARSGSERLLLAAATLSANGEAEPNAEERARRERQRLVARGIARFELSADGRRVLLPFGDRLFVLQRSDGQLRELEIGPGVALDPRFSPDGRQVAYVQGGELHVIEVDGGPARRLTDGAGASITHGLAEFVAQEEMGRHHGYWWSPDSRQLLYQRTDTKDLEIMHIMDATRPEQAPATWPYPRPGKPNAEVRLGLLSLAGGPTRWIEWDRARFEYLVAVRWEPDAPLTLLVQNRLQTEAQLLAVDIDDGSTATLLVESDAAWLNIDDKMPQWLPGGERFLWTTERHGASQLELRDRSGRLLRALTETALGLQEFEHFDAATGTAVVRASADPTQSHLYRVAVTAPAATQRLTTEPGVHDVVGSGSGPLYVVRAATLEGEERFFVAGGEGPRQPRLRSVAEDPRVRPRLEFTTVGSEPQLHAVLVRPRDFEADARYPVIVHVYGGPTSQMVRRDPARYLLDQWFADQGFVVVALDGRGTPGRGRAWQRQIKGDLIRLPLEDQARGLRLLGQRYAELDLSRVGIYGWSFGGYVAAMAVMREPELFRAGVAGAPVVAWEDYDTHYTERYMDLPQNNAAGYAAASVLSYADDLTRPLLLIHGTADDNVYFMHSLKLSDALFRAGKSFEFLPLPGFTHMVPDPVVTERLYRRILQFLEHRLKPDLVRTSQLQPTQSQRVADDRHRAEAHGRRGNHRIQQQAP